MLTRDAGLPNLLRWKFGVLRLVYVNQSEILTIGIPFCSKLA